MRLNSTRLHRLAAAGVFAYALVLYGSTISPSTAFWDTGEFIASAYGLQVMHPPGAPLFMLLGRFFSMFVPAAYVALTVSFVSVLASALTILLTYLIIVWLVRLWQPPDEEQTPRHHVAALGGGLVGALTFAATDSFWFNAVEAEVYALAMGGVALVVWLALRWQEQAALEAQTGQLRFEGPSSRHLVLIAYVLGLSVGIHLMVLLAFFFVALVVYFQHFAPAQATLGRWLLSWAAAGATTGTLFLLLYPGMVVTLPEALGHSGAPFVFVAGLGGALAFGLYLTHLRRLALANLALLCVTALLAGYSTYSLIPTRSAADPTIDLNDPETTEAFVSYLKREQYGQSPLLRGANFDDRTGRHNPNHEVLFPRRHSYQGNHEALYAGYTSDWDYFWRYQVGHMYVRYFLWNFSGRAKDAQHAPWITGFSDRETARYVYLTPSERASRNAYYLLPLLLGFLGLAVHFRRDARRALAVLALFLVTGLGLVLYLNEVPITPRERDYIYVASYFAFALWIGLGAAALLEAVAAARRWATPRRALAASAGLLLLLLLAVPGWMSRENYDDHDRSGNVAARDFAYNLLMSLDENAIVFTGGDNDTYPLWYLQEVEGIRRDVRVVCLPLLNTGWYAKQLKNQWAGEAAPLPISLTDTQLEGLQGGLWEPRTIELPADPARLTQQNEFRVAVEDTNGFESPMRWTLAGRPAGEARVLYPADLVILDILQTNARQGWVRPVYFSAASAPSDQLNLQPYFQREGLAFRIVPIRHDEAGGRVVPALMEERLSHFRFTGLADPDVYHDDMARNLLGSHYRSLFTQAAEALLEQDRPAEAERLLHRLMDDVPLDTIPIQLANAVPLSYAFGALDQPEQAVEVLRWAEPRALSDLAQASSQAALRGALQGVQVAQYAYMRAGAFDAAARLSEHLATAFDDPSFRATPDDLRRLYEQLPEGD